MADIHIYSYYPSCAARRSSNHHIIIALHAPPESPQVARDKVCSREARAQRHHSPITPHITQTYTAAKCGYFALSGG